jgi:DNA-binding XRE family transcriptional regulator
MPVARQEHQLTHSIEFHKICADFGSRVREKRLAKDWTLQKLGHHCRVSLKTIHGVENGNAPSLALYVRLCDVLNGGRGMIRKSAEGGQ